MADDEQLSDFLSSQDNSIGSRSTTSGYNNRFSATQKNNQVNNTVKRKHVTGNNTSDNNKLDELFQKTVGGVNLEDDREDEGLRTIDCFTGINHIPRLVFLGSEEDVSSNNIEDNNCVFENNNSIRARSESDSYKANRDTSNSEVGCGLITEPPDEIQEDGSSEPVLTTQHSRTSLYSTDSELLADHNTADNSEDIERFIMENEMTDDHLSKLLRWHCHDPKTFLLPDKMARNQLITVCILCFLFMVGEAVGGAISNSLALFTDVLHLGSDLVSFLISLLAIYLARKPATKKMSFGYHRAEVLGALFSVFIIWSVTGVLVYMAVERIVHEHYKEVKPDEMLITASLGVFFNLIMGFVLHSEMCCKSKHKSFGHNHSHGSPSHSNHHHSNRGHHHSSNSAHLQIADDSLEPLIEDSLEEESGDHKGPHVPHQKNINVRAAFIHVLGDIIQSVGVLIAALIIKIKPEEKYRLADPICTFLFSVLVLFTTITVLRDTLHVIMEGVPRDMDYHNVKECLQNIKGVKAVHGLTLWCLTLEKNALAVHLAADPLTNHKMVLLEASEALRKKFDFVQTTIQVEDYKSDIMSSCGDCQAPHK